MPTVLDAHPCVILEPEINSSLFKKRIGERPDYGGLHGFEPQLAKIPGRGFRGGEVSQSRGVAAPRKNTHLQARLRSLEYLTSK